MIEEALINFGGIGILALVLFYQNQRLAKKLDKREESLSRVVANNTIVMTKFSETIKKCKRR